MGFQAVFGVIFVLTVAVLLVQTDVSSATNSTQDTTNVTISNLTTIAAKVNVTGAPVVTKNDTDASTHDATTAAATTVEATTKAGAEGVFSSMVIVSYALCLTVVANM